MALPAGSSTGGIGTATLRLTLDYAFGTNPAAVALDETISNANSPLTALPVDLASGNNSFTAPTGSALVVFLPPPDNTVALQFKANAVSPTLPVVWPFAAASASNSFAVSAASAVTGCKLYYL